MRRSLARADTTADGQLRTELDAWMGAAVAAGLGVEDVEALVAAVRAIHFPAVSTAGELA